MFLRVLDVSESYCLYLCISFFVFQNSILSCVLFISFYITCDRCLQIVREADVKWISCSQFSLCLSVGYCGVLWHWSFDTTAKKNEERRGKETWCDLSDSINKNCELICSPVYQHKNLCSEEIKRWRRMKYKTTNKRIYLHFLLSHKNLSKSHFRLCYSWSDADGSRVFSA